ncbi:MAG: hypothetical protein K5989_04800, partial [Lachnospiraceae bacterium]|nr:hypothetical protein [Lachnospiraceae bacterium]
MGFFNDLKKDLTQVAGDSSPSPKSKKKEPEPEEPVIVNTITDDEDELAFLQGDGEEAKFSGFENEEAEEPDFSFSTPLDESGKGDAPQDMIIPEIEAMFKDVSIMDRDKNEVPEPVPEMVTGPGPISDVLAEEESSAEGELKPGDLPEPMPDLELEIAPLLGLLSDVEEGGSVEKKAALDGPPDLEMDLASEMMAEAEPEPMIIPEMVAEAEAEPEPLVIPEMMAEAEPEPMIIPEMVAEAEAEAEPEPLVIPEMMAEAEPEPMTIPERVAEAEAEPEPLVIP